MWRCNLFVYCLILQYTVCLCVSLGAFMSEAIRINAVELVSRPTGDQMEKNKLSLFCLKGEITKKMEIHWPFWVQTVCNNNDEARLCSCILLWVTRCLNWTILNKNYNIIITHQEWLLQSIGERIWPEVIGACRVCMFYQKEEEIGILKYM